MKTWKVLDCGGYVIGMVHALSAWAAVRAWNRANRASSSVAVEATE